MDEVIRKYLEDWRRLYAKQRDIKLSLNLLERELIQNLAKAHSCCLKIDWLKVKKTFTNVKF